MRIILFINSGRFVVRFEWIRTRSIHSSDLAIQNRKACFIHISSWLAFYNIIFISPVSNPKYSYSQDDSLTCPIELQNNEFNCEPHVLADRVRVGLPIFLQFSPKVFFVFSSLYKRSILSFLCILCHLKFRNSYQCKKLWISCVVNMIIIIKKLWNMFFKIKPGTIKFHK